MSGKIKLPPGNLIDIVRKGMSMNIPPDGAARSVGMNRPAYRLARKLLMMKDRQTLNEEESTIVDESLKILGNGHLKEAMTVAKPILDVHWDNGSLTGRYRGDRNNYGKPSTDMARTRVKQRRRFDNTVFAIREACTNNDELTVPELTVKEKREAIDLLMSSMKSLWDLMFKIKGETNE
jgi:hypothetical protein